MPIEPDVERARLFWSEKGETEKALIVGFHGPPETRPEERSQFLGELRERVLIALHVSDVKQPRLNRDVLNALKDPRAKALIVDADLPYEDLAGYIQAAKESGLRYSMRSDPGHTGDIALVVVSDQALS